MPLAMHPVPRLGTLAASLVFAAAAWQRYWAWHGHSKHRDESVKWPWPVAQSCTESRRPVTPHGEHIEI